MSGPSVTISEVFAYLGGAFLLAAWSSFMTRANGPSGDPRFPVGAMSLLAAGVLGAMGLALRGGSERMSRAAGVAFLLVASYAAVAAAAFGNAAGLEWPLTGVVASAVGLTTAIALRVVHPSVLTQVGVLGWLTALVASTLVLAPGHALPRGILARHRASNRGRSRPLILVVATAAWWLVTAVVIALIGLREARIADRDADPGAGRRADEQRSGQASSRCSGWRRPSADPPAFANGEYGRVVEPWIGDLALVALSAILIERAFRRDADVVHLRRGARPVDRPDGLQPDLPLGFDRGRVAHRGPHPARGRGRRQIACAGGSGAMARSRSSRWSSRGPSRRPWNRRPIEAEPARIRAGLTL